MDRAGAIPWFAASRSSEPIGGPSPANMRTFGEKSPRYTRCASSSRSRAPSRSPSASRTRAIATRQRYGGVGPVRGLEVSTTPEREPQEGRCPGSGEMVGSGRTVDRRLGVADGRGRVASNQCQAGAVHLARPGKAWKLSLVDDDHPRRRGPRALRTSTGGLPPPARRPRRPARGGSPPMARRAARTTRWPAGAGQERRRADRPGDGCAGRPRTGGGSGTTGGCRRAGPGTGSPRPRNRASGNAGSARPAITSCSCGGRCSSRKAIPSCTSPASMT
jgi:hypothetical protein